MNDPIIEKLLQEVNDDLLEEDFFDHHDCHMSPEDGCSCQKQLPLQEDLWL